MHSKIKVFGLILSLVFSLAQNALARDLFLKEVVICKLQKTSLNKEVRSLRVYQNGDGSCVSTYFKEGSEKVIAQSKSVSHCTVVLSDVEKKLKGSQWTCKRAASIGQSISQEILSDSKDQLFDIKSAVQKAQTEKFDSKRETR